MEPEDRYRMLRDDVHWNPIRLTPRSQPSLASQRERRGSWLLRGTIAVASLMVLAVFVTVGLSSLSGPRGGPAAPADTGPTIASASVELSCPPSMPYPAAAPRAADAPADGADTQLLPFQPSSAIYCVYSNGPEPALSQAFAVSDAAELSALHDDLDQNFGPAPAKMACTADLGPTAYLRFSGAGARSIDVEVALYGCQAAINGTINDFVRTQQGGDSILEYPRDGLNRPSGLSCPIAWPALGGQDTKATLPTASAASMSLDQAMLCRYGQSSLGSKEVPLISAHWSPDADAVDRLRAAIAHAPVETADYGGPDCPAAIVQGVGIRLGGSSPRDATLIAAGCGPDRVVVGGINHVVTTEVYKALRQWPGADPLTSLPVTESPSGQPTTPPSARRQPAVQYCPPSIEPFAKQDVPGADARIVPFTPTVVTVCDYGSIEQKHALIDHFVLDDPATLAALLGRIDADAARPQPTGGMSCPNDDGSGYVLYFANATQHITVWQSRSGCVSLSNGQKGALSGDVAAYLQSIE